MAVDVVGYSRLMGRDESGTLARLQEHRNQHFEPVLARHAGRLVKLIGDGAPMRVFWPVEKSVARCNRKAHGAFLTGRGGATE
jgi:class 3 adenylate cyclase